MIDLDSYSPKSFCREKLVILASKIRYADQLLLLIRYEQKSGHGIQIRTWDTNPDIFGQGDISTLY